MEWRALKDLSLTSQEGRCLHTYTHAHKLVNNTYRHNNQNSSNHKEISSGGGNSSWEYVMQGVYRCFSGFAHNLWLVVTTGGDHD